MSKTKKYLLLSAGILLLAYGIPAAVFAIIGIANPENVDSIANNIHTNWGWQINTATLWVRLGVAYLASSSIISIAFGVFSIRYAFYTSREFEEKRSVIITMAILSFICSAIVIGGLFLAAALVKDHNYDPEKDASSTMNVASIEDQLIKLNGLKEKSLITEEEYNTMRAQLLNKK